MHDLGSHDFDFLRHVQLRGFETSKPAAVLAGPRGIVEFTLPVLPFDTLQVIAGGDNYSTARGEGIYVQCAPAGLPAESSN